MKQTVQSQNRRDFIKITGGAAGIAALTALGISTGQAEEQNSIAEVDVNSITSSLIATDVLVVGGGMAGLFAAVKAHDAGAKVLLVSKGRLGASGQTPFARGIFSYDPQNEKLNLDQFVKKVSESAISTNNPVFTRQVAEHSYARVQELREWGFFDSAIYHKAFSKPIKERNIPVIERVMLTHLLKQDGKVTGAAGFKLDDGKVIFFSAKSVVLCTGAGGFKPNGFPICDLTHDGTVMAYNIGAKITGKEWNDGHPGRLENPASVYSQWGPMLEGPPNTTGVGIRHDLGVDMNYATYMQGPQLSGGGGPPGMGNTVEGGPYRPAGLEEKRRRPPHEGDKDRPGPPPGRDNGKGPFGEKGRKGPFGKKGEKGHAPPGMGGTVVGGASAGMAIHKAEGLVPINEKGESNIPGLYAAGDALGSYMAGAIYTQIGSSLAGSAVQGAISGEAAAEFSHKISLTPLGQEYKKQITEEILAPMKRKRGYSPAWVTRMLQSVMIPNFVIYVKKERMLQAALIYIEELLEHHQPKLIARDMHELRLAHETTNMLINAEMKLKTSMMRKESRCSHYRLDYPDLDRKNWDCWINIFKGKNGQMEFEKQKFDSWPE